MDGSAQLTEVRFTRKRQGYDPDEVDNFLERVGERVYDLQENVRAADQRVADAERQVAEAQKKVADAERRLAASATNGPAPVGREGAARPGPAASEPATKSAEAEDLEETLKNTLILAQRTADTAVKEATAEAERILAQAKADADRRTRETDTACKAQLEKAATEAQQRVDAASGPIKTEVVRLEEAKKRLSTETAALDSHLAAQRDRIREALATLQAIVDDPTKFSVDAQPAPSGSASTRPSPSAPDAKPARQATNDAPPARRPSPRPAAQPARPSATPAPVAAKPLEARPTAGSAARAAATARPAPAPPATRPSDDGGPPTAEIDLTSDAPVAEDDNFLDELRRAVGDAEPEVVDKDTADEAMQAFFEQQDGDLDAQPRRSRFGRRH